MQPVLVIIVVLTCPGFLLLDLTQPKDLQARIMLGIGASIAFNLVLVNLVLVMGALPLTLAIVAVLLIVGYWKRSQIATFVAPFLIPVARGPARAVAAVGSRSELDDNPETENQEDVEAVQTDPVDRSSYDLPPLSVLGVDINNADAEAFTTLPDVGPDLAAQIVQNREEQGAFASVDDLLHLLVQLASDSGPVTLRHLETVEAPAFDDEPPNDKSQANKDIDAAEREGNRMTTPFTVSAIIPTRNRPELLRRTIAAMLGQEGSHLHEILVVFDQSEPDQSLVELSDTVPIRVITNARTPGLAGGRNTGIEAATGDWIAFCDDDDVWAPNKLDRQLTAISANPETDFAVGSVVIAYGEKRVARQTDHAVIRLEDLLRDRIMEAHPSTYMIRRSAIKDFGFVDEELPGGYAEDYDWLLRAARVRPVLVASEAVTEIEWHPESYFGNRWETIDEALEFFVEKTPEFANDPRGLARINGQRAFAQAAMGQTRRSLSTAWNTFRLDWRQPRAYIVPVVASRIISAERLVKWANATGRGF
ncbi:MAG: glycosyltransferase [bacterium]|nr:glycosyltransferase [bacterium]